MDIKMHGRNFHVEDRFRESAESKVARAARFFDGIGSVDVEVTEERNPRIADERFRVEITTSAAGNVIRVAGAASTADAAVDVTVDRLGQQMKKLKGRLTILVVAHRLSTIMNADQVYVLEKGRIVESGSRTELLTLGGRFRELHDMQFAT